MKCLVYIKGAPSDLPLEFEVGDPNLNVGVGSHWVNIRCEDGSHHFFSADEVSYVHLTKE